jgi:o-succinylbenzoate---CoA ligase
MLDNFLAQHAATKPDALALNEGETRLNWHELHERMGYIATKLAGLGVKAGSRVGLLMVNGRLFAEIVHAVLLLRATLVPLNLRLTPAELAWQIADVEADVVLFDEFRRQTALEIRPLAPNLRHLVGLSHSHDTFDILPDGAFVMPEKLDANAIATIVYSSGTTGKPKGVQLSLANHYANALASRRNLPITESDNWLAVLPMFHVGGLAIILRGLFYGMPVTIQRSFDPATVNAALDNEGVTIVSVVATMLARMLDERQDRPYPASLRCLLTGGGPVPRPLLERCAAINAPVMQTYGMTETASQAVTLAPEVALKKLGSAGKPLGGMELRIEQDGVEVAPGEVGEIVLRGDIITPGYYNRPEATAQAWRGGWFHTGDAGYLDPDGYLYVVDRRDDLIISGGENIYPAEIEATLLAHPAVEDAGVIGAPDAQWGQHVVAFVQLRKGQSVSEAELSEFCRARLAKYKIPRRIIFRDSLPRNAAGKLLRRVLREEKI